DQQCSAGLYFFIDRAYAMPAPWLDAFDHCVVEDDRDVALIDIQLGAALRFEFLFRQIMGDEGEVFARDAIPFGRIAVTPVRETDSSHPAGNNDNVAADLLAEILLKNTAIVDFNAFNQWIPPTVRFACTCGRGLKRPPPRRPNSFGSIERMCSSMACRASTESPA